MADKGQRLDYDGLLYVWQKLKTLFAKQSDLDTTNQNLSDLSTKVDGLVNDGGEPNTIESISVNSTALTPDSNKNVDITVPTNNNQLTNGAGYQTASDVESAISGKADSATTLAGYGITDAYTKTQTNTAISNAITDKADKSTTLYGYGITDAYTKTQTDTAITNAVSDIANAVDDKADAATTLAGYGITDAYTSAQTDTAISNAVKNKANSATTLSGYGITDAYTKTETATQISNAVSGKANAATTLSGYGITDAYTKTEANTAISNAVSGKADAATTLSGYGITDAYTKTEADSAIATAVSNAAHLKKSIVTELPTTGEDNIIYLVPNGDSGTNIYDEYMWINSAWEKTGSSDIDLSGYVKTTDIPAITNSEIDTIVAS